jgi:serine/threonine protein kinase
MFKDPKIGETIQLDNRKFTFTEAADAPGFLYAEIGRKAKVYRLVNDGIPFALKVFKPKYRIAEIVENSKRIVKFKDIPGMVVADRKVITPDLYPALVNDNPSFLYGILMPWVEGKSWFNFVSGKMQIDRAESQRLARSLAASIASLEERSLAHCDLSSSNFIFSGDFSAIELIDIEDMFGDGLLPPRETPKGTPGYAASWMRTDGVWEASADRFTTGILISEILCWQFDDVRAISSGDSFFTDGEFGNLSRRFQLIDDHLKQLHPELSILFRRVWYAESCEECPRILEWKQALDAIREPILEVEPNFLDFRALDLTTSSQALPHVDLSIKNAGKNVLNGQVITNQPWLKAQPSEFSCPEGAVSKHRITLKSDFPHSKTDGDFGFTDGITIQSNGGRRNLSGRYRTLSHELVPLRNWTLTLIPLGIVLAVFAIHPRRVSFADSGAAGLFLGLPSTVVISLFQWLLLRRVYSKALRWVGLNMAYSMLLFTVTLAYYVGATDVNSETSGSALSNLSLVLFLLLWLIPNYYTGILVSRNSPRLESLFRLRTPWNISFWIWWLLTPILGLLGAIIILVPLASLSWLDGIPSSYGSSIIFGLWGGLTGLLQWANLRRHWKNAWFLLIANVVLGAMPWGENGRFIVGAIFVLWIVGPLLFGPLLSWKLASPAESTARNFRLRLEKPARAVIGKGLLWGPAFALLGLLQTHLRVLAAQPKPPPSSLERFFSDLSSIMNTWFHNIWLANFIEHDPGKAFMYAMGIVLICLVLVTSLDDSRQPSRNKDMIDALSVICAIAAITGLISGWIWLSRWVSQQWNLFESWFNTSFPVWERAFQGVRIWQAEHDPSHTRVLIAIVVAGLAWYVQSAGFSKNAKFSNESLFTNIGFFAGILQLPAALLLGLYILFVFPEASYGASALTNGLIGFTFGWFYHTSSYLLTKDYGVLQTASSPLPFFTRILLLSGVQLLMILFLFFGCNQIVGVNHTIYADKDWQRTNIVVSSGDLLMIVNTGGAWSADPVNPDLPYIGGQGYTSRQLARDWAEYPFAPLGSLLAKVGAGSSQSIYSVGKMNFLVTKESGSIYLRMNDYSLVDNDGNLQVWILNITELMD